MAFDLVPHPIVAKKGEQAAIRTGATLARASIQAPKKHETLIPRRVFNIWALRSNCTGISMTQLLCARVSAGY